MTRQLRTLAASVATRANPHDEAAHPWAGAIARHHPCSKPVAHVALPLTGAAQRGTIPASLQRQGTSRHVTFLRTCRSRCRVATVQMHRVRKARSRLTKYFCWLWGRWLQLSYLQTLRPVRRRCRSFTVGRSPADSPPASAFPATACRAHLAEAGPCTQSQSLATVDV